MEKNSHLKKHLGYWLSRLQTQIHIRFEHRLSLYSISVAQWCILISLYDKQANSLMSLAKYIEVHKSAISRVVEQLVKNSLVTINDGADKRSQIITLTEKSQKLVPQLLAEANKNDEWYFNCLNADEISQLKSIIKKMIGCKTKINLDHFME